MKLLYSLLLIGNIFAFEHQQGESISIKNDCQSKYLKDDLFNLNGCLTQSDGSLLENIDCIVSKQIICTYNSQNYFLDTSFEVKDNSIYFHRTFQTLKEIKYIAK
jgi:hypothetical protein